MFGTTFYFGTLHKYVALFGTIFNDIHITREDADGEVQQIIKVPVSYGPKEKVLNRLENDPDIQRDYSILLPRMSFEITGMEYDADRKLPSTNYMVKVTDSKDMLRKQFVPVPWNIDFKLSVIVKNQQDGMKIVEQILPFFTPDWTTTVLLIPEMDIKRDIPIVLNGVEFDDKYDGNYDERKMVVWEFDFTLKGYFFGPVREQGVIKYANTNFFIAKTQDIRDAVGQTPLALNINVRPGLTANGEPTSNAALSVPASQISIDDDFGFIVSYTDPT